MAKQSSPISNEIFKFFSKESLNSISDLEKTLQFKFLSQNSFQSTEEQLLIKQKGLEKQKASLIKPIEIEYGKKYKDKIENAYSPYSSVRWINEQVEYGLFAEEDIPIGAYVGEYTGVVRPNDRLYTEPLNNYCYEYPVLDDIDRSYVIDATDGNLTRFINHSFTPNLKSYYAFFNGYFHLIFISIKEIKKGTQLSYSYGKNYWYLRGIPQDLETSPII